MLYPDTIFILKNPYLTVKPFSYDRACSENSFLDKRYNDLDIWLRERGYSDKLVQKQILKAREY